MLVKVSNVYTLSLFTHQVSIPILNGHMFGGQIPIEVEVEDMSDKLF